MYPNLKGIVLIVTMIDIKTSAGRKRENEMTNKIAKITFPAFGKKRYEVVRYVGYHVLSQKVSDEVVTGNISKVIYAEVTRVYPTAHDFIYYANGEFEFIPMYGQSKLQGRLTTYEYYPV